MELNIDRTSNLVKTKSIERVLAPVASQVSLLIILSEKSKHGSKSGEINEDANRGQEIISCTNRILKSVQTFIDIGQRQVKTSSDVDFNQQMKCECENLELSCSNLNISCKQFEADINNQHYSNLLIENTKDVLHCVLKLLLVSDKSSIGKIIGVVKSVQGKLDNVKDVSKTEVFEPYFKVFSDSMELLMSMLKSRQSELIDAVDKQWLTTILNHLKQSIPSLQISIQTYLKYPDNPKAQISKNSLTNNISSYLIDVKKFLQNKSITTKAENTTETGYFVSRMSQVIEMLSEYNRYKELIDLEPDVTVIVGHSMTVAHYCVNLNRSMIIRSCQRILQAKDRLLHLQSLLLSAKDIVEIRYDYDDVCEMVLDELCDLEKEVNISLLHLIIDIFKETVQPGDKLLKLQYQENYRALSENLCQFSQYGDKICQVAKLVLASSTNSKRVKDIKRGTSNLEKLQLEINNNGTTIVKHPRNAIAQSNFSLLVQNWKLELSTLVSTIDIMSDPQVFLQISEKKILDGINYCKYSIKHNDKHQFRYGLNNSLNYSKRVCDICAGIIDSHNDPVFSNGFQVFLNRLKTARTDVKEAGGNLIENFTKHSLQDTMIRRLNILEDCVCSMKNGLSSDNHLPLLHPERVHVRKQGKSKNRAQKPLLKPNIISGINERPNSSNNMIVQQNGVQQAKRAQEDVTKLSDPLVSVPDTDCYNDLNPSEVPPNTSEKLHRTSNVLPENNPPNLHQPTSRSDGLHCQTRNDDIGYAEDSYYDKTPQPDNRQVSFQQNSMELYNTDPTVTDSEMRRLSKRFVSVCVNGNRKVADEMTTDLLRLTNHILDCSTTLIKHCPHLTKHSEMKRLSSELDDILPKMIEEGRYVLSGDEGSLSHLHDLSISWSTKYDKLRIHIEVATEKWNNLTLDVHEALLTKNIEEVKTAIGKLSMHEKYICDILKSALNLPLQSSNSDEILDYIDEQCTYINSLTSQIISTVNQCMEADFKDGSELILDELYREWCVCMTCGYNELKILTEGIFSIGYNSLPTIHNITQFSNTRLKHKLLQQTDLLKDLVTMVAHGDTKLKEECNEILFEVEHVPDELDDNNENPKPYNIYQILSVKILLSKWILLSLPCVEIISSSTRPYTLLIDDLLQSVIHHNPDMIEAKVKEFKSTITNIQEKILHGIILSPDLTNRGMVRKCLDDITEYYPQIIDIVIQSHDESDMKSGVWPLKHKFGARFKRIIETLGNMSQVKTSLIPDLKRLLNAGNTSGNKSTVKTRYSVTPKLSKIKTQSNPVQQKQSVSASKTEMKMIKDEDNKRKDASLSQSVLQPLINHSQEELRRPDRNKRLQNYRPLRIKKKSLSSDPNESFIHKKTTLNLKGNVEHIERQIEKWNENNNPIVIVTSSLTTHVQNMMAYCVGEGDLKSLKGVVRTAESVVVCCEKLRDFGITVCNLATDSSHVDDLLLVSDQISTASHQLKMISKVFLSASRNHQSERILTRNACELMESVREMFKLAEIICIKGISKTGEKTNEEMDALALLNSWKKRLFEQRKEEKETCEIDELGLRRIESHRPPSLTNLLDDQHYT